MIYLDYSANTPADPEVLETFISVESSFPGNPNSSHPAGDAAKEKLAEVTSSIAQAINVLPEEIIYTSGASEANNLAVKGIARAMRGYGKHIISTMLEHPSVGGPLTWLQEQGYEIDLVDIKRDGTIDTEHLAELIREDTVLVAVTAVDSELGTIQPIDEISEIVYKYKNCRLHVDATQAVGKIPFSFGSVDTASFAAHKFYGLNGSGILYKRKDIVIDPLIHGGAGSSLYRSGTPTLALAAALERALIKSLGSLKERYGTVKKHNEKLRVALSKYTSVSINSPEDAVPHILNVSVAGIKGTEMQRRLSEHGVCVSVKSACSTDGTPSKAVYAVSRDRKNALSSWRISLSHLTTDEEIERFLEILERCIAGGDLPDADDPVQTMGAGKPEISDPEVSCTLPTKGTRAFAEVACEHTMNVFINGKLSMRIVCTPQDLRELVVGRLFTEGLIDSMEDIQELSFDPLFLTASVKLKVEAGIHSADNGVDTVPTCCTDNKVYVRRKKTKDRQIKALKWDLSQFDVIMSGLNKGEPIFSRTHATHACYLAHDSEVICCMEDIGRHNALDKAVGYGLLSGLDLSECFLFTTGRMPTDMVKKVINAGIPLLASKTFPTSKAVEMADKGGVTLVTVRSDGTSLVWTGGSDFNA